MELEPDDPRVRGLWAFDVQTEQQPDGHWQASYPHGGWFVTADTEDEARNKAVQESLARREDPEEIARKLALMRRHLIQPVPGVQLHDHSVLKGAWDADDPATELRRILNGLSHNAR